jgi:4-hydroxy-tetrahydrodipicolinate reductase
MSTPSKIAILGAGGRMGRALILALADTPGAVLSAAVEYAASPLIGQDASILAGLPASGILIGDDVVPAIAASDVVIEFSTPAATVKHAELAAAGGVAYLAGTTGLATCDEDVLREAAERIPVVYAANYSIGMTLLADLVKRAAGSLGPEFDIEIVEMHHKHKVDAPSGSALALGRAAAAGRGVKLEDAAAMASPARALKARSVSRRCVAAMRAATIPSSMPARANAWS